MWWPPAIWRNLIRKQRKSENKPHVEEPWDNPDLVKNKPLFLIEFHPGLSQIANDEIVASISKRYGTPTNVKNNVYSWSGRQF